MNMHFIAGHSKVMVGSCQHVIARLVGHRGWMAAGAARMFTGRGQVAIGEAQRIIKRTVSRMSRQTAS